MASLSSLNTRADPVWFISSGAQAERFTTVPSGARFPNKTAIPPLSLNGFSIGRRISGFLFFTPLMFSAIVFPVAVIKDVLIRFFFASSARTACTPPASSSSHIKVCPAGAKWQRFGVLSEILFTSCRSMSIPASCAIAGTCSIVLEEQPSAMSAVSALRKFSAVIICRAVIPFLYKFMTAMPACFASAILSPVTAGIVPFPGSPRPRTSVRQFIEFAVNIPEHAPQPGQARCSISLSCSSVIFPTARPPTASNISVSERFLPE